MLTPELPTLKKRTKKQLQKAAIDLLPADPGALAVLTERARQLAQQHIVSLELQFAIHYIYFKLGDNELYGIPFANVKEVLQNSIITPVPRTPEFIAGIINKQGKLLTIIDLKKFFNLTSTSLATNNIIIVEINKTIIGVLADNIIGSSSYNPAELQPALPTAGTISSDYISGLDQGKISILNLTSILNQVCSLLAR